MKRTNRPSIQTLHVLIDTCVWLDIAKQADGGNVVAALRDLCGRDRVELIVPQIVIDEFERNRGKVQTAMTRSVSTRLRDVRKVIDEHGRGSDKQKVLAELDNISHQAPLVNELATQTFDAILGLLHTGMIVRPTSKMKQTVIGRALAKQAPFHREKNSVADALLIEMYKESAEAASSSDPYCFVTHNTKDFSTADGDVRYPHADFSDVFSSPYSLYFNGLQDALVAYLPEEMEELDFELNFHEEPRPLSEVLPYLGKLEDQIWYNRHKNLEYEIDMGEHQLVDKYDKANNQTTTVKNVWKSAQAAARKVEEKYGSDELGPWDDFEWGMLNGKLSAIRWMLGEDWETSLDT